MSNPFSTLGIASTSSKEQAKAAFRKLAQQYHPDRETADEAKFKSINEAMRLIEGGWSEPKVAPQTFTQPPPRGYYKPEDPVGTWRNKDFSKPKPAPRPQYTYARPQPRVFEQRIVQAEQVKMPKKNLGTFIARVSMAEAYKGFDVEIALPEGKKIFKMPKGTPNDLSKDFDVDGGKITITAKFMMNVFQPKGLNEAVYERTMISGVPANVVRTGDMVLRHEVPVRDFNQPITLHDFLGEAFTIKSTQFRSSSMKPEIIKVPGRGYVDWYPEHDRGGDARADLYVHLIPLDVVPMATALY